MDGVVDDVDMDYQSARERCGIRELAFKDD